MLIEIGFRPNNLFVSNSSKHFPISPSSYAQIPHANIHDAKSRQAFSKSRKKTLIKRSLTMPYSEEGSREGRTPITKCLGTIENDLDLLGKQHQDNPFKGAPRIGRKEGATKGRPPPPTPPPMPLPPPPSPLESFPGSSARVAVEFPLFLNVGSIYSSHVVVYLDP